MLLVLIAVAVVYSYIVVRGEGGELLAKLSQRILVQQGEMWWMTYERVFLHGQLERQPCGLQVVGQPFRSVP